jgi:hypothetical protein
MVLSVASMGLLITLKLAVKAQDSPAASPTPAWMDKYIGLAPGSAGIAQEDAFGVCTVTSSGWDIWDVADAFHYMYQPMNGDGQIVARVLGMQGNNNYAKSGVMIRETLDANSRNAMMWTTLSRGTYFHWRLTTGGFSEQTVDSTNFVSPYWVKLVRKGDWLGGYSSPDGTNWTLLGSETIDGLADQVYVGMAVSSSSLCTASFDHVSVGPAEVTLATPAVIGTGDGLLGSYYANRHLYGIPVTNRVDAQVDFSFSYALRAGEMVTNRVEYQKRCCVLLGMPKAQEFSVCWAGEIQAQFTEPYTLYTESDAGMRVWLNEQLIINDWAGHPTTMSQEASATVNLVAGQRYLIRIEYYRNHDHPDFDFAVAKLRWSSPSTPKQVVPQSQLYSQPTDTDGNGLPDIWQMHYFGHLGVDPNADPDQDGLSNLQEYLRHSDPTNPLTWGLPTEWWQGDIGDDDPSADYASYSNGVFTLTSRGADIWWGLDSFHYVYQPLNGNGQIVARVLGIQGPNPGVKAGVMVREMLDDNSKNGMMLATPGNGMFFQWRTTAGDECDQTLGCTNVPPYWVKAVRWGDWVGGYCSPDGTNWTLVSWETSALTNRVFVGLALTGFNRERLPATAMFDHVSVGPADPSEVMHPQVGIGDGLLGKYYNYSCPCPFDGPPVTNEVDAQVAFDWLHGEPMSLVNGAAFAVCWSGEIQAQFSEPYTFYLDCKSADWVRVWLDEQLIIDTWEKWHSDGEVSSGPIKLIAGQRYLFRIEYLDNYGQAVAHLRWSSPSTGQQLVPQSQLYSQPTDTDGNGLPDRWQMHYFGHLGVDPNADPDHDGLSNLQEYLHNTNPTNADTDGDGMPDGWEVAHGLNPTFNDAGEDPEQDGLSNLQKYLLGINPNAPDTGGPDGLPYGLVIDYLGVNPTNLNGLVTEAAVANGSQATNFLGNWQVDGNDIYALSRRGAVEFNLTVSQADKYVLKVIGTQNVPVSLETGFSLVVSIDGESPGHRTLNATYGTDGVVDIVTPYLTAGTHTVRVFWDGAADFTSLRIRQVKLLSVADPKPSQTISRYQNSRVGEKLSSAAAPNANGNGIKDWVEKMLADESGLDLTNPVISSYTSPVCLEGRDPYLSMMNVNIDSITNNIPVRHNAGLRWYANVPLLAPSNTVLTVSYQNGGRIEQRSVEWQPVNVLHATNLTIRIGDSLLLTAQPDGSPNSTLSVTVGTQQFAGRTAQPVIYGFTNAGVYTVTGTYAPGSKASQSGSITVTVVGYNFTNYPAAWLGYQRVWDLANVPTGVVMQADSRLFFQQTASLTNNGEEFSLRADLNEPRSIVARVGANGPLLDTVQERGVALWLDNQTYTKVIQVYPDGSQLVEMLLVWSPVLPDLTVEMDVIVSGVVFEDGTTTKVLTPPDFDVLGQAVVRFIRPASCQTSVCHAVTVWQGPAALGTLR